MFASWTPLFALLLLITDGRSSAEPIYKKEGDEVVISPGPVAGPITSIEWKHQDNIASQWNGGQTVCYREFNGRCQLNKTTGELIITGLLKNNSGSYTAEINYRVFRTTEILVISAVPTPTITTRCSAEKTDCVLTCEGNTEGAEPAKYEWMSGDGRLGSDKELNITKEEKYEWFKCTLGNPVSNQTSEQVLNPFSPPKRHYYEKLGTFIPLILLVCVILLFLAYHKRSKAPPTRTSNEDESREMEGKESLIPQHDPSPSDLITEVGDSQEETGVQDAPSEEPTISRSEESDHRRDEEEAETIPPTQQSEISSSENKEDEKSENQEAAESVAAPSNSQQGTPGPDGKEGQRKKPLCCPLKFPRSVRDKRPLCPNDPKCYRKNMKHWEDYRHTTERVIELPVKFGVEQKYIKITEAALEAFFTAVKEKFNVPAEQHLRVFDSLETELDDDDVFERTIEKFPDLVLTIKKDPEEPTISESTM